MKPTPWIHHRKADFATPSFLRNQSLKREPVHLNAFSWVMIFAAGWLALFLLKLWGIF